MKFNNIKIDTSKSVLFPRLETEYWAKKAISQIKTQKNISSMPKILDIFAGTGCIGIFILKNLPNSNVDFLDISNQAIEQIKINLKLNNISNNRYQIIKSNIFEEIRGEKYDFIFANPPYVAISRIEEVDPSILKKEPHEALFAGQDGMIIIRKFLYQIKNHLKDKGEMFMEFDPSQKPEIEKILQKHNFSFKFYKDQFNLFRWLKLKI